MRNTKSLLHLANSAITAALMGMVFAISPVMAESKEVTESAIRGTNTDDHYILGIGDAINVVVFGEPELTMTKQKITGDGTLVFPLIGSVPAKGMTIGQLTEQISVRYEDGYLKKPKLAVTIAEYRSFYVNGEVRRPGAYQYIEGLTIRKAIMMAGGLSDRGTESKLELRAEHAKETVPVEDIDSPMKPGDIIIVGASLF